MRIAGLSIIFVTNTVPFVGFCISVYLWHYSKPNEAALRMSKKLTTVSSALFEKQQSILKPHPKVFLSSDSDPDVHTVGSPTGIFHPSTTEESSSNLPAPANHSSSKEPTTHISSDLAVEMQTPVVDNQSDSPSSITRTSSGKILPTHFPVDQILGDQSL